MINKLRSLFMKMINRGNTVRAKIFILLTFIGLVSLFLAIIADVIVGENIVEIIVLLLTVVFAVLVTFLAVKMDKIQLGASIIAAGIVFGVVPIVFIFGGGLTGGGIIWFVFAYLYIGIILVGRFRVAMLTLLTAIIIALYTIGYLHPMSFDAHLHFEWYLDSLVSLLLVGFAVYFMVLTQYRLYLEESEKAKEQAKRIEELNKAQNRFFSSMSHEIRTPINTIIGLNEMTIRECISPDVADNARNIQSASKILLSLINDILDMSKIESGNMDIVNVQYDVGKMLSDIVSMIWVKAEEKGLKFSISVDPSMPSQLFSDEVRLKQILINLLNNAVKYTKEGRVSFSVHCTKTGDGKALVTYTVEDTGMGIRKESIPHLFDAFRREDEEKNRYIEGTGLGLSIVKQLVELMGGTISVNSVYTKGSTFVVAIEQEIADERIIGDFDTLKVNSSKENYQYHQSFEAPNARLLVVDDNSTNIVVVKKLLKDTRIKIDTADSGEKCLNLTLQHRYDLILMDHLMPGMDGIECLHKVREQPGGLCKETPVVALTANAGGDNQALYKREGFDEYLVKPVDSTELEHTVMMLLPADLVKRTEDIGESIEDESIVREIKKKVPIIITTESSCDIPQELRSKLNIPVIPYKVRINDGIFYDTEETGSDAVVRYLQDESVTAYSVAPTVAEYEEFFSEQLTKAQHIIHISMARHVSEGYANACEAALAFYNVRVVDSGQLSGGLGIIALYAKELSENNQHDADKIVAEIEKKKEKVQTSFVVNSTDYLYRSGQISNRAHMLCDAFMLHPLMGVKKSKIYVIYAWIGGYERIRDKYIRKVFGNKDNIDRSVLFITYAGMKREDVEKIKEDVEKVISFDKIYIQKNAPSVAINGGPGVFGLLYSRK